MQYAERFTLLPLLPLPLQLLPRLHQLLPLILCA